MELSTMSKIVLGVLGSGIPHRTNVFWRLTKLRASLVIL